MIHEIHTTNDSPYDYGDITHIFLCTDSEKEFPELKKRYGLEDNGDNSGFQFKEIDKVWFIFADVAEICSNIFEQVLNMSRYIGFEMSFPKILSEIKRFDE